ncbi:MAG: hypothetical protein IJ864_03715 [Alphaproteobacteria bacterium]|nr:hypothetical protein [Alphaproteobacteria bacterium]
MSDSLTEDVPFSPILVMEFIRQVTINRFLNSEAKDLVVKFRLAKGYYEEIKNFPIQAQTIHLNLAYDETTEILSVTADEVVLEHFRAQKSLMEIAGKYENQYAERYSKYVAVLD